MAKETVTGATVEEPEVTATAEEPTLPESTTQDSTKKLEEVEAQIKEFSEQLQSELKRRQEVEAQLKQESEARTKAEQAKELEERKYKGLQRETNIKADTIKRLESQLVASATTTNQLRNIEKLVAKVAEHTLDPDQVASITREVEQEAKNQELERLRTQVAQQAQTSPSNLDPEYRFALYNKWFRQDFPDVNPFDLSFEEWHVNGADSEPEWVALVRAEFEKRQPSKKKAELNATDVAQVRADIEAQIAAQREESQKQVAAMAETLRKTQEELEETKRLAQEQLNRTKGMDKGLESVGEPGTPSSTKKIIAELASLNDEDLYSKDPKVREAYSKKVNDRGLRDKLIADMMAKQPKQ